MLLKSVKLVNFCQHVNREVNFSKGLNLIVGPNGSGKSNILNGIYGCLTGDFTRNDGISSDNVTAGRPKGKATSLKVDFSHNGYDMSMTRTIDPSGRELILGGIPYTSDKEVAEKLLAVLNVDKTILDQYVFIEQWDHFGPLALTPKTRIGAFQKLYRLDRMENIAKAISSGDAKLADIGKQAFDLQTLKAEAFNLQKKGLELIAKLQTMPSLEDLDSQASVLSGSVDGYKKAQKLRSDGQAAEQKELIKASEIATIVGLKANRSAELLEIGNALDDLRYSYEAAKKSETDWVRYESYMLTKGSMEQTLEAVRKEKEAHQEPIKPSGYIEDTANASARLDYIKFRLGQAKNLLSSINEKDKSAKCPTCETPVSNLTEQLKQAHADSTTMADELLLLSSDMDVTLKYNQAKNYYDRWFSNWLVRANAASGNLASLEVYPQPVTSKEEAKKVIDLYNATHNQLTATASQIQNCDVTLAKLSAEREAILESIERIVTELKDYEMFTEEDANSAASVLETIRAKRQEVNKLNTDIAVNEADIRTINGKISFAENQERQAALHVTWNHRIDDLRRTYKYDALPTVVCFRYTQRVVDKLNDILSTIGAPFTISLQKDLAFLADFGSHKVNAGRLSGGQKVLLAIAYRIAVNCTFASNLGLLCLDEPTVGLDDGNIGALEKAFECLKEFSETNGVQILVVTHERGIKHLFDNTVDLS
jgi:DNA repair exonuclease SbcCD ATPase subunit